MPTKWTHSCAFLVIAGLTISLALAQDTTDDPILVTGELNNGGTKILPTTTAAPSTNTTTDNANLTKSMTNDRFLMLSFNFFMKYVIL